MGQVANALGVGTPFEFRGKTYTLSPWTYKVQGLFERYLEEEALRAVKRMQRLLTPEEYREQLKEVRRDIDSGRYTFGTQAVADALQSLHHLKYLLFLMLQENHPEVDMAFVEEIVKDKLDEVMETMAAANIASSGGGGEGDTPENPPNPAS